LQFNLQLFKNGNSINTFKENKHNMSTHLVHVTDNSFELEVLNSEQPVLVDYWAEWCGPCKSIAPILDEVSREYEKKVKIAKLDVDQNHEISKKYGIRGIPTLMLFKDGNVIATHTGALSKSQLTTFIDSNI
tara:strand:+ start:331 stop:726 length:396 start_codon:yes stop_codon:yes gene_type:complete